MRATYSCLLAFAFSPVFAHHSTLGFYDRSQVTDASGSKVPWDIEMSAVSVLRTRGLDQNFIQVGDHVRVSGHPSRRGRSEISGRTVLLDDGTEVITALRGAAYFTDPGDGNLLAPVFSSDTETLARRSFSGIFRVWSTVLEDPAYPFRRGRHPATVHMNASERESDVSPSLLGYSTGRWEGRTFVVETSRVDFAFLDDRGTPQSPDVRLIERFTLDATNQRLDYRITVTDPATFAEPFDLTRYWTWRPEITVGPWDCQDLE